MKKFTLILSLIFLSLVSVAQDFVITGHGVSSDSTMLQTKAIQAVIDKAFEYGGGTIVLPKGVYLTGALFFRTRTRLRLEEGAVLKGSDNIEDYPLIPSRMEGQNQMYYSALVNAYYVDSFSITGPGAIDGNGLKFWKAFWEHRDSMNRRGLPWTNLEVHRPRLVFIWGSNNVSIQKAKLRNSGFWTTHIYQCTNVLIEDCDIRSPFKPVAAPSTDGIDIDACKKVVVRNCYISVNDDAVCIKGGKGPTAHKLPQNGIVEDVLVENCSFGDSHGALTLGSECIHAKNIVLRNCTVNSKTSLLRLKMRPDTYQVYENITIQNVKGSCGSLISLAPWTQFFNLQGTKEKPYAIVRNISFSNIDMQTSEVGTIKGNPTDKISNISFKDVKLKSETPKMYMNDYPGIRVENVVVNGVPFKLK